MKVIERFQQHPHLIFLIDGLGAILTALLLLLALPNLPEVFTMPARILQFLGSIAVILAAYSVSNYFIKLAQVRLLIRIIAVGNLLYCLLSVFIVSKLFTTISAWDKVYFAGEVLIVLALAVFEWKLSQKVA